MTKDLNKLAREIVKKNQYLVLGTVDTKNNAWVSPVAYAYNSKYIFYFVSIQSSLHCTNADFNDHISWAIFDSRQKMGTGVGLQIGGKIKKLTLREIPMAAKLIFSRKYPYGKMSHTFEKGLKKLLDGKLYRFYKLIPTKIWMNNPNSPIDERIEVSFNPSVINAR